MQFDTGGTQYTEADVANWLSFGVTPEQVQASLDYNRRWLADEAFRLGVLAEREAEKARVAEYRAQLDAISAAYTAGDYDTTVQLLTAAHPELAPAQAAENVAATLAGREPVIQAEQYALHKEYHGEPAAFEPAAYPVAPVEPAPARTVAAANVEPAAVAAQTYDQGPALGFGLPDYTDPAQAAAAAANDARLVADPGFVAHEIQRTNAVIEARIAEGLPTAAQEFYLYRLYDQAGGGDWYASGQTPAAYAVAAQYGPAPRAPAAAEPKGLAAMWAGLGIPSIPWWGWLITAGLVLVYGRHKKG